MASQVDLPSFHSLQFTTATLSAFPFSGGIKKMTLNCLQNKTAALSLELDKEASKHRQGNDEMESKGDGGVIKSHLTTRIKMHLQVVFGTPGEGRPRFPPSRSTSKDLAQKSRSAIIGVLFYSGCCLL